jgi:protein-S-isoprenylcysteine O-methyltransferase Ste14
VLENLRTVGWLACVVYSTIPAFWLLIHLGAEYWRRRTRSPYRLLIPAWIGMWLVVALITARWRGLVFYRTAWTWIPAIALFAFGLWLYRESKADFTLEQLSGVSEMQSRQPERQLVVTGLRARMRHPVYVAHLSEMLAWSIGTGLVMCFGLTGFAMILGFIMIRAEEGELEQRFGELYRAYRDRVPAFVPRFGARRRL